MTGYQLVIVTGQSGAGKSQVIKFFEDLGFFCVDNLPLQLLTKFVQIYRQPGSQIKQVALVIDIREGDIFDQMSPILEEVKEMGIEPEILFLEANDETLLRRFSETRRSHPWSSKSANMLDNIRDEKQKLSEIRGQANLVINTSSLSIRDLKDRILQTFGPDKSTNMMSIMITAFGYKYGLPLDADLVIDLRFLPNPFYVSELRASSGLMPEVKKYVLERPEAQVFLEKFYSLIDFIIPQYIEEKKRYLNIALGCTGGKHRSVVLANELALHLSSKNLDVKVSLRDAGKE